MAFAQTPPIPTGPMGPTTTQTGPPTSLLGPISISNNFVAPAGQKAKPASATPGVGGNYSLIDQVDDGNDAKVLQEGTTNGSFIYQIGDNTSNLNRADVVQRGNVQPGVSGENNYAQIDQDGEGNNSKTRQYGDENDARSYQLGMDNTSSIQQGSSVAEQAEDNLALVDQQGDRNNASVQQRWDNNEASSTQLGNDNKSIQEQNTAQENGPGQIGVISQTGNDNEARQFQQGIDPNNQNANYAEIIQGGGSGADATDAFAQQVQVGRANEALIEQRLSSDDAYQDQKGDRNKAIARQNLAGTGSGGDNLSMQTQDGKRNEAEVWQQGNNNKSFQEQVGEDNKVFHYQAYGQLPGDGNRATSLQDGDMNDSQIFQSAFGNTAIVDQLGSGHMSFITQNQYGTVTSFGASTANTATVIQRNSGDTTALRSKTNLTKRSSSLNGSN
jgi:hypothetical protein